MPKSMTPEEKAEWGAKMKAARAAKKVPVSEPAVETIVDTVVEAQPETAQTEQNNNDLVRQIEELKASQALMQALIMQQQVGQGPQVNARGRMVGTFERYVVDPNHYPDPTERLKEEPRLARVAFPINYELRWNVSETSYDTIDGVRTREPRFNVELHYIIRTEDGEATDSRAILRRMTFHEDPQAAMTMARERGLDVDETNEKAFLDEMRYLRVRDWLLDAFYPPKAQEQARNKELVINNRLVEVFELSSENPKDLPFDSIKGKI